MEALFVSVKDAAVIIGVDTRHVYYLAEFGYLEGYKIRGIWRFYKGEVECYAGSKGARRVNKKTSYNNVDRGGISSFGLFPLDSQELDFGRDFERVSGGGRPHKVANKQVRRNKAVIKTVKSIDAVELEFDFGIAV